MVHKIRCNSAKFLFHLSLFNLVTVDSETAIKAAHFMHQARCS